MPMIAVGSGSPVGAMIVVSPVRQERERDADDLRDAPKVSEMSTMTPSAGQNRPRMSVHERAIACGWWRARG